VGCITVGGIRLAPLFPLPAQLFRSRHKGAVWLPLQDPQTVGQCADCIVMRDETNGGRPESGGQRHQRGAVRQTLLWHGSITSHQRMAAGTAGAHSRRNSSSAFSAARIRLSAWLIGLSACARIVPKCMCKCSSHASAASDTSNVVSCTASWRVDTLARAETSCCHPPNGGWLTLA
jgi:hypothetical protein